MGIGSGIGRWNADFADWPLIKTDFSLVVESFWWLKVRRNLRLVCDHQRSTLPLPEQLQGMIIALT